MNNNSELALSSRSTIGQIIGWLFGILVFAIGIINTFWGNDPGYGIFIILLSFIYFPPVTHRLKAITGRSIPMILKLSLGVFILWTALGVGELFGKIGLMMQDFK